ncbi:MAG: hypothetical protein ACIALR_08300 [Blastopirellula sp. JB062]
MIWAVVAITAVLAAIEIAQRCPLRTIVSTNWRAASKSLNVMRSRRISDHWKEHVLMRYAGTMFLGTLRLSLALAAIALPLVLWSWAGNVVSDRHALSEPFRWQGALLATLLAAVWLPIRGRIVKR